MFTFTDHKQKKTRTYLIRIRSFNSSIAVAFGNYDYFYYLFLKTTLKSTWISTYTCVVSTFSKKKIYAHVNSDVKFTWMSTSTSKFKPFSKTRPWPINLKKVYQRCNIWTRSDLLTVIIHDMVILLCFNFFYMYMM